MKISRRSLLSGVGLLSLCPPTLTSELLLPEPAKGGVSDDNRADKFGLFKPNDYRDNTVCLFLQFAMGQHFELTLMPNGDFWFTINANPLALFSRPEIGLWRGNDNVSSKILRDHLIRAVFLDSDNTAELPAKPLVAVTLYEGKKYESDIIKTGLFSLDSLPRSIALALKGALRLVNGKWGNARWQTLSIGILVPESRSVSLQIQASGPQPVTIPWPLTNQNFSLELNALVGGESITYDNNQIALKSGSDLPPGWRVESDSLALASIPVGEKLSFSLAPSILPASGCYSALLTMQIPTRLTDDRSQNLLRGQLTSNSFTWCVSG